MTNQNHESSPEAVADVSDGPNELLAKKIVATLLKSNLIMQADAERVQIAIGAGKIDRSVWKLVFENRIEKREAEHERE